MNHGPIRTLIGTSEPDIFRRAETLAHHHFDTRQLPKPRSATADAVMRLEKALNPAIAVLQT
ncbi:MAG TPA: hypothetical protein PLT00_12615 [Verrucomicrobiota bacterium]|jgi:hypothetical protein|nr:MAG: hypothetical protein BWX84_01269 [Verrucomicrobia bacterium ADurb.Bin118]HPY31137.1 hypothetical protein [Verrucomicrobiota bacterium]HQB17544.1 hypothetical protein [Verrucomicrobiota bacterium]